MADQSVNITNLPKNEAQVALDLFNKLRGRYGVGSLAQEFELFDACLSAAKGQHYTVPEIK